MALPPDAIPVAAGLPPDAVALEPEKPKPTAKDLVRKTGETGADFMRQYGSVGGLLMAPAAAAGALGSYLVPYTAEPGASLGQRFRNEMQNLRHQHQESYERSPVAAPAGTLASAFAVPLPAPATQAAIGARATPAALAAAGIHDTALFNALLTGSQQADRPDVASRVGEAAISPWNLLGAAPVVALEARNTLKTRSGERMSRAENKAAAKAAQVKQAEQASLTGKYGGLRQTENKAIREAAAMEAAGTLTPENAALLAQARASGRFDEALNEALANDLQFLTTRQPEVQAAKTAMQEGAAALPAAIQAETAAKLSPKEMRSQFSARLKRYLPPLVGSGVGVLVGGPIGIGVGALAGAGMRPSVQAWRRFGQNPAFQYQTGKALSSILGPGQLKLTPQEARSMEFYMAQALSGKGPRLRLELAPGVGEEEGTEPGR